MNKTTSRRGDIEFLRFIAAMTIVCHHSMNIQTENRICYGGWIFVEFFFLLTGYFSTKHMIEKDLTNEKDVLGYVFRKVVSIIPYAYLGIMLEYVHFSLTTILTVEQRVKSLVDVIINFLFLNHLGWGGYSFNGPLWYVQGILLVLPLVLLVAKKSDIYKYYLCWIIPIMLYTVLMIWHGTLQWWTGKFDTTVSCLFRSCAAMMLGSFIYFVAEYLKRLKINNCLNALLRVVAYFLFAGTVLIAFHSNAKTLSMEIVLIFIIVLILFFSTSDWKYGIERGVFSGYINSFCCYLGRLSLPIFCLHVPVMKWVSYLWNSETFVRKMLISIGITIVMAVILEGGKRLWLNRKS